MSFLCLSRTYFLYLSSSVNTCLSHLHLQPPSHFTLRSYDMAVYSVVAPLNFTLSFGSPLTVLLQTQEYLYVFISRNWISCLILR